MSVVSVSRSVTKFSHLPDPFEQKINYTITILDPFQAGKEWYVNQATAEIFRNPIRLLDAYHDAIEECVERRIALFFRQAVTCYKMHYYFQGGPAVSQLGQAHAMTIIDPSGVRSTHRYQAAHNSTIPCLYRTKNNKTEQYLPDSQGDHHDNSVSILPEDVNKADSLIEGNFHQPNSFRNKVIQLLNWLSHGSIDPVVATKEYITLFGNTVLQYSNTTKDIRRYVLEKYLNKIRQIYTTSLRSFFFDWFVGVDIVHYNPDVLRKIVYLRKYQIITAGQITESNIALMLRLFNEIFAGNTIPIHKLQMVVLRLATPQEKVAFEKLFCKSAWMFEDTTGQVFTYNIDQLCQQYPFERLMEAIRMYLRDLRAAKINFRAGLLRDLRKELGWSRKDFATVYNAMVSGRRKMTVKRVEFLETRCKIIRNDTEQHPTEEEIKGISYAEARRCAQILFVDQALFLSGVFLSNVK